MKPIILTILVTLLVQFSINSHSHAANKIIIAQNNCQLAFRMYQVNIDVHYNLLKKKLKHSDFLSDMKGYTAYDIPANREFVLHVLLSSEGYGLIKVSVKLMRKDDNGGFSISEYEDEAYGASEEHALKEALAKFPKCSL
ncbi:MAG: hypothetical protein A2381_08150 [Bdellovibrionales bacterium RIFOXYB1_FULL_37_110]|nr:MAG: hypothetical protein A2181_04915 [Bdellovibrionales bacterium RIFOXYA1_FULL_38_20]OFZ52575.1 MAG: hypothetical protein A2417_00870 [Bdellovibrionales bacterium RIFOXYC1_FULL_37_79]OFZ59777.1 MAG: hypothetical protein A2381_08150 [Bdellovibrionales bacterium RIFOXYB1_FULL_37_110]OFZ65316.1 MAG: hypothetical protein A2577_04180 [Bdellovibrionales bacterium RIFOXYD1_FULL_36_51]